MLEKWAMELVSYFDVCGQLHGARSDRRHTEWRKEEGRVGVIARYRVVPRRNPYNPLTRLATILRSKGFDMDVSVDSSIQELFDDANQLLSDRDITSEPQTYDFYISGYGKVAKKLITRMGMPATAWQIPGENVGIKSDIVCRVVGVRGRAGIAAQAEIKMNEEMPGHIFQSMERRARSPAGMRLDWSLSVPTVDFDLIDTRRRTIAAKALAQVCKYA
jgi:hypothetical protein